MTQFTKYLAIRPLSDFLFIIRHLFVSSYPQEERSGESRAENYKTCFDKVKLKRLYKHHSAHIFRFSILLRQGKARKIWTNLWQLLPTDNNYQPSAKNDWMIPYSIPFHHQHHRYQPMTGMIKVLRSFLFYISNPNVYHVFPG